MTERPMFYKLIGTLPVPTTMEDWAGTLREDKHVTKTEFVDGAIVSTIFLGFDHGLWSERPILFETMIFPLELWNGYQTRCSTYEEALAMHQRAIDVIKQTQRQLPVVVEVKEECD